MTTTTIIKEIDKLPLEDRLLVIEKTLRSIRQNSKINLSKAVDSLYNDYKSNDELTIFSELDIDPFYEAR